MSERQRVCSLSALADPGSLGSRLQLDSGMLEILLVRRGDEVFAYHNRCPHTGVNLDWQPDQFLDLTNRYIQCATHGALFRLQDGFCLRGPCAGQYLRALRVEIEGEQVFVEI
jgi:nitrite reductase/ring-hydroxylating ferredoxin subunit